MCAGDRVKRIGRADQPRQLAGSADTPREQILSRRWFCAFSRRYGLAEPQLQRRDEYEHKAKCAWSPCAFRRAGHEKQRGDMWLCQTHDAPASEKPVRHRPKMGYAVDPLLRRRSRVAREGLVVGCGVDRPTFWVIYPSYTSVPWSWGRGAGHRRL